MIPVPMTTRTWAPTETTAPMPMATVDEHVLEVPPDGMPEETPMPIEEGSLPAWATAAVALDVQRVWFYGDVPVLERPFWEYSRAHDLGVPASEARALTVRKDGEEAVQLRWQLYDGGRVILVHDIHRPWAIGALKLTGEPIP